MFGSSQTEIKTQTIRHGNLYQIRDKVWSLESLEPGKKKIAKYGKGAVLLCEELSRAVRL